MNISNTIHFGDRVYPATDEMIQLYTRYEDGVYKLNANIVWLSLLTDKEIYDCLNRSYFVASGICVDFLREIGRLYNRNALFPEDWIPKHSSIPFASSECLFTLDSINSMDNSEDDIQDEKEYWVCSTSKSFLSIMPPTISDGDFIVINYHDNSWSDTNYENISLSTTNINMVRSLCMNIIDQGEAFIYVLQCSMKNGSLTQKFIRTVELSKFDLSGYDGRLDLSDIVLEGLSVTPNLNIPILYWDTYTSSVSLSFDPMHTYKEFSLMPIYPNIIYKEMTDAIEEAMFTRGQLILGV